jgi:hypothetical protein
MDRSAEDHHFKVEVLGDHSDFFDAEPVFVFRGKDQWLPAILAKYDALTEGDSPSEFTTRLRDAIGQVQAWQSAFPHLVGRPD